MNTSSVIDAYGAGGSGPSGGDHIVRRKPMTSHQQKRARAELPKINNLTAQVETASATRVEGVASATN